MSSVSVREYLKFLNDSQLLKAEQSARFASLPLDECVDKTFHFLHQGSLKSLVEKALKFRDQQLQASEGAVSDANVLGHWGPIIDSLKATLVQRRQRAGSKFQKLIQCGMQGDPDLVIRLIEVFQKEGSLDHLFMGILEETLNAVTANNQEEHMYMIQFFRDTIENLQLHEEIPDSGQAPTATPSELIEDEAEVHKLIQAGNMLDQLLAECIGDVKKLQARLVARIQSGEVDKYFLQVIDDNMRACEAAGYQNKYKLFTFMRNFIVEQQKLLDHSAKSSPDDGSGDAENEMKDLPGASMHHAPQFVDNAGNSVEQQVVIPESDVKFFDATSASDAALKPIRNRKKKNLKREARLKVSSLAEQVSDHLNEHGWAVMDKFLPLDLVRRVRIEANLFRQFYEQSEIWVGKRADIGAHVRVPSVRGDKVLWVCGGHRTGGGVEQQGLSRNIDHYGQIEPCRLEVKAQAPIRQFMAMRELLHAVDKLVDGLKAANPLLKDIYERSDAMFSIFPGDGARFAKHIDNTTYDGRRLTLVIYLNPGWEANQGGCLRLTEVPRHHLTERFPSLAHIESEDEDEDDHASEKKNAAGTTSAGANTGGSNETTEDGKYKIIDILPAAGRIAIFYSAVIPHEVMPSFADRHAISIWFYDKSERQEAVERAKETGTGNLLAKTNPEAQIEAQNFIAELMGGDEVGDDGGDPTPEELSALGSKVAELTSEALEVVASITGAPSSQSFRDGFPQLTTNDLKSMRALFRRMGLNK
jgi:hypothetical protein